MIHRIYIQADGEDAQADIARTLESVFPGHTISVPSAPERARRDARQWSCLELTDDLPWERVHGAAARLAAALPGRSAVALRIAGDSFRLALFRGDACVRELQYQEGDGWLVARGEVQPWEAAAFFDDDDFAGIGEDELRNELGESSAEHRAYTSRKVVEGAQRPCPPHIDRALAAALSLPSREPPSFRVGPVAPSVREASKVGGIALVVLAAVVLVSALLGLLVSSFE
ncbi:hypothetical protein [Sandaracinus amylolyticus]|uniref:Uncharacterized protein n=1 Tax=Sandaracinus amylolyticus TaxID=927083 RepID=A0A0F6W873_9BACT|nr:hypothetical protein [Sandaracinus amylolyticus]AKF09886.1 hypothetical protein DB32_007035 [Sandaracinus amylolyticus]